MSTGVSEMVSVTTSDPTVTDVNLRRALAAIAEVLRQGARTHRADSWREHDPAFHADRAIRHIEKWESGDDSEPHLAHAATRLLMALQLDQEREG